MAYVAVVEPIYPLADGTDQKIRDFDVAKINKEIPRYLLDIMLSLLLITTPTFKMCIGI